MVQTMAEPIVSEQLKEKTKVNDDRLSGLRRHSEELNRLVIESLQGALLQLVAKKPYDSITVTELCKKAGVSRMAFYGNFDSKDDILKKIVYDLQIELFTRIGSPFRQEVTYAWYLEMFRFIAEKSDVLKSFFCAGYQGKYLELINARILRHKDMQPRDSYQRLLWCGGIVNAVVYWLCNDMEETPEEMATFCDTCFVSFYQERFWEDDE